MSSIYEAGTQASLLGPCFPLGLAEDDRKSSILHVCDNVYLALIKTATTNKYDTKAKMAGARL